MTMRYHYGLAVGHTYSHGADYRYPTHARYENTGDPQPGNEPATRYLNEPDDHGPSDEEQVSGDEEDGGDDDADRVLAQCLYGV